MPRNHKKRALTALLGVLFLLISLAGAWGVKLKSPFTKPKLNTSDGHSYIPEGETFRLYVNWNESVNESTVFFNKTHSGTSILNSSVYNSSHNLLPSYFQNETFNSTWTNFTVNTTGWSVGKHWVKIAVNSTWENGGSVDNITGTNVTLWDSVWSTNHEFAASPSISLNWTNSYQEKINLAVSAVANSSHKIHIDNTTTNITANYSQDTFYRDEYGASSAEACFNSEDTPKYDIPLLVKNSSDAFKSTTSLMPQGDQKNYTLIHNRICPPGRYWGHIDLRNISNSLENVSLTTEINVPISTKNELSNTTGIGYFNGTLPANASTYHSYYFNTSNSSNVGSILNATGIRIELNNLARDLDLFLLDGGGNLKAKSIEKGSNSESLIYNYLPEGEMWEIRTYGNHTSSTDYGGVIHFTTLNATNTTSNKTLTNVDFGDLWPSNQTNLTVTLKNEGPLNFTDVNMSRGLYHKGIYSGSSAQNFTFLVPSSATKVKASINWTGSSVYNLSLYRPNGSLAANDFGKREIANVTGVEQEEWVESSFSGGDEGFWEVRVMNETNLSSQSVYNLTTEIWFDASKWISTNYTTSNFMELGTDNSSRTYYFNLSIQNNSLAGKYKGWIRHYSDSGAVVEIPLNFNLTSPELLVNRSIETGSVQIKDNIGFNRTGSSKLQVTFRINNTGNKNMTFESISNSSFLNGSSNNYMDFTFNRTSYVNPGDSKDLTINVTVNTSKAGKSTDVFKGWIIFNDTLAQPSSTFNLTVKVNLTDKLDVIYCRSGSCDDGLQTSNGNENDNTIENVSRDEYIILNSNLSYKNGTRIKDLTWRNFSAWIKERNTSYTPPGVKVYNNSDVGGDIWYDTGGWYEPNISIPVNTQNIPGGYYNVYLKASHNIHGVELNGTTVHDHLIVNASGLEVKETDDLEDFTSSGAVHYYNVSATNYGPVPTASGLKVSISDCGSWDYTPSTVDYYSSIPANGSARHYSWKIEDDSTNLTESNCNISVSLESSSDRAFSLASDSFDIDTYTSGGGGGGGGGGAGACNKTAWTNQSCGGGTCSAIQMYQTRSVSPSGCAATERCIDAPGTCGSYGLSLSLDPKVVNVTQGKSGSVTVSAENTGDLDLENLELFVSGEVPKTWYNDSPSALDVSSDSSGDFTVDFSISKNSPVGIYEMTYKANNSEVSSSVDGELWIEPTENRTEELNRTYQSLKQNVTELSKEISRILQTRENTTDLNQTYQSLLDKVKEAGTALNKGNYAVAKEKMDEAKTLYSDAEQEMKEFEEEGANNLLWIAVGVITIIVTAILLYLLYPAQEGYHPEKGYQYRKPGEEKPSKALKSGVREFVKALKEKLGAGRGHEYDYKGGEKWKPEEKEE